jgi:hypothetical protein
MHQLVLFGPQAPKKCAIESATHTDKWNEIQQSPNSFSMDLRRLKKVRLKMLQISDKWDEIQHTPISHLGAYPVNAKWFRLLHVSNREVSRLMVLAGEIPLVVSVNII